MLCLDGLNQAVEAVIHDTSEDVATISYEYLGRETLKVAEGKSWLGMFFPFVLRPSALELLAVFFFFFATTWKDLEKRLVRDPVFEKRPLA